MYTRFVKRISSSRPWRLWAKTTSQQNQTKNRASFKCLSVRSEWTKAAAATIRDFWPKLLTQVLSNGENILGWDGMEWLGADSTKMRNHRDKVAEIRSIQKLMLLVLLPLLLLLLLLEISAIRSLLGVFANFGLFIVVFGLAWLGLVWLDLAWIHHQQPYLMRNNNSSIYYCYLLGISSVQCGCCRISYADYQCPYVSEFPWK